jgi:putative protease
LVGAQVDRVEPIQGGARLHLSRPTAGSGLVRGTWLHRNRDQAWEAALARPSATRAIPVRMRLVATEEGVALTVRDAHGHQAEAVLAGSFARAEAPARAEAAAREALARLGGSVFCLAGEPTEAIELVWDGPRFIPVSQLNRLRREAIAALEAERARARPPSMRLAERDPPPSYPAASLDFMANVYNALARGFYARHGVERIDPAYEAHQERGEVPLMVTKHCLRFAFSLCPKQAKGVVGVQGQIRAAPMQLVSAAEMLRLEFDCKPCEMHVIGRMRPHIAASPPPRIEAPLQFFPRAAVRPTERSTR